MRVGLRDSVGYVNEGHLEILQTRENENLPSPGKSSVRSSKEDSDADTSSMVEFIHHRSIHIAFRNSSSDPRVKMLHPVKMRTGKEGLPAAPFTEIPAEVPV